MSELSGIEEKLSNKPTVPVEKLVDGVLKLVGNLDFTDKQILVQILITKIIAKRQEVTIWGHIPILATEQVGLNAINRHSKVLTQLPFELKLLMPRTDRGGRGYSNQYVANLKEVLAV